MKELIDAMAEYLDLPVEPEYRAGIGFHLTAAKGIAQDVLVFDVGDEAEPAPVFRA